MPEQRRTGTTERNALSAASCSTSAGVKREERNQREVNSKH